MRVRNFVLCAAMATAAVPSTALGQAEIVPEDDLTGSTDKDVVGWNPSLAVSSTVNLVNNTNVVGQVEGTSALFGLGMAGGADYVNGRNVWRTTLSINEGFAKTPVVDDFVKTNDELALETSYNYFLARKLGLFTRAKGATALFPARAITADPVTYTLRPADPDEMETTETSDDLKVASAFKPFNLDYSTGVFAQPLSGDALTLRVRAGFGGRHTFADGVFVNNDDAATMNVELQELANVHQAGVELFAGLVGKAKKNRLSYTAGASVLLPFVNNDKFDRSASSLTRVAFEATAQVAVFDWMNLVYKGSLVIDPQLFPADDELTQVQNSFLLSFQYTLIDRKKGLKELEKEAAKKREKEEKAEALRRAKEAEERAKRLEEELKRAKETPKPPLAPAPETKAPETGTQPTETGGQNGGEPPAPTPGAP